MLSTSTSSRSKQRLNTSEEVEQYNLQIQESIDSLCNLHAQSTARSGSICSGISSDKIASFNWPTAIVASVVLLPAFLTLTFGAFELYGAKHIEIAAVFAAVVCAALITYVARAPNLTHNLTQGFPQNFRALLPRLNHEITSYSIATLICVPLWVILYLLAAAFVPVHTSMAVASFLATAANLYLGGPFGEKKRRVTSNIASSKRQSKARRAPAKAAGGQFRESNGAKFKASYLAMKPEAVCKYYQLFFTKSAIAQLFEHSLSFAYAAHERELVIDAEAPGFDIIPKHKGAKFTKSSMSVRYLEASKQDRSGQYRQFLASWALRMAADALLNDRAGALDSVIFNAFAQILVPETGKDQRGCLLSVRVTREDLARLDISRVDKMACLRKLGARLGTDSAAVSIYSSTPISAIQPLRTTSSTKYNIKENVTAADSSLDLLSIDPVEFEHLIASLLVRMGLETQLTKASHDGGIDIVALDKRPILGGKIVIQAKRYKRTVPVSCVRDLYGAMQHEGASKAILVTTSKLGADAWQFADGKPLQLIEGQQLVDLLRLQGIPAHL
ncbi:restriction endonuclease [bacterium]|nr:restriction endonuclease [bacterium]MBP9808533.1 restriction endonuclease [bacterium]